MKKLLFMALVVLFPMMQGCNFDTTKNNSSKPEASVPPFVLEEPSKEPEKVKPTSPYTGEEIANPEELIPFVAIVENSKAARPQSGLNKADIVFETLAEGGIPRFIALYYSKAAEVIGPIRSARPYFVNIAEGFNLPLAHCGGSAEAISMINEVGLKTMNEFHNGSYYWRDSSRKAPHNLYTSSEKLKSLIEKKNYISKATSSLSFDDDYFKNPSLPTAEEVSITFSGGYTTSYLYSHGKYIKSISGDTAKDRENGEEVAAVNLVIQKTDMSLKENGVHLDIKLFGEGEGFLISEGRYQKIIWRRESSSEDTVLYDEKGNTVPLSVGNTWWHIVDKNSKILINGL